MGEEIRFRCPVAARCGGCQMEKMSYAQQLATKQDWVRDLLRPYCRVDRILGMENPFHYRNKTHAVIVSDKRGNVISGVYRMGTHQVVPVDDCLIENEKADEIIRTIRSMLASFKIRPYREDTRSGLIRHVLVRTGHISGQIMVVLVAAQPILPRKNDFVAELLRRHPEITTVVLNVNDRATSMVLGKRDIVLYGEGYIEDTLCGKIFRISPQSFYQVNSVQTEVLYNKALEYAGLTGREVLFDAYCGIGTIGITASDRCAKVIGVDVDQAGVIAGYAGVEGMTVTSAMKGLYPTTYDTLTDVIVNGNWDAYKGKIATLGLVSGDDPELNYVQIPMGEGTQWSDSFTQDDYKAMVKDMFDGKITVSNDVSKAPSDFATVIAVEDQGAIKG